MRRLKDTRASFGMNQQEMAQALGISRSTLAKTETGRYILGTAALLKLGELEKQTVIKSAGPGYKPDPALLATCQKQIRQAAINSKLLQKKLEILRMQQPPAAHDHDRLPALNAGSAGFYTWQRRAERRNRKCGQPAQQKIALKLFLLKAKVTALRAFMQKLRKGTV